MNIELQDKIKDRLREIDEAGGKLVGKGAILSGPKGYISGNPYLLSTDLNRAFRFRDQAEARAFMEEFPVELMQYFAVELK